MKRIQYFILLGAMLLASCNETTTPIEATDAVTISTEAVTESIYPDLGIYDYDGRTFTIAYALNQMGDAWPYEAQEEDGDIFNDALFRRDRNVEEKYNVDINWYDTNNQDVAGIMQKSMMAGDNDIDLGLGHMFMGITALLESGGLYDFNQLPFVDFSKPWWAQHLPKTLEVDGKLFLHVSDLVHNFSDCIFFNKDMLAEYHTLPDPYMLVREGTWTWDKFAEMAKSVSTDLNGDGNFDENDRYGYLMTSNYYIESNWVYASGLTIASIEDGEISLDNVMSERMIKTAEIMYDLVKVGNHTFIPSGTFNPGDTDSKMFIDGKALFHETTTTLVIYLRNASLDFGIVPLPKYDETQEDYYSMATTQMMMVPSTLADPDFTGLMLESLAMESHRLVRPAVYETSFSEKYLRDEDSFEMYNIIRDSGVYDFNWNFGDGNAFSSIMATLVRNGTPEKLASFYASNEKSVMRKLTKVLELIQGS